MVVNVVNSENFFVPFVLGFLVLGKAALHLELPLALAAHKALLQRERGLATRWVELRVYSEKCTHINR